MKQLTLKQKLAFIDDAFAHLRDRIRDLFNRSGVDDMTSEASQESQSGRRGGFLQRIRDRRQARRAGRSRSGGFQRRGSPGNGIDTSRLADSEADSVEFTPRFGGRFRGREFFNDDQARYQDFIGSVGP